MRDGWVDIGGRRLHLICTGSGRPTVVLEAGLGDTAATWAKVQPVLEQFTAVCSYDRAGLGQSESAPTPRTVRNLMADLRALLCNALLVGPFILVGHSYGGQIIRLFAAQYPADVLGLVLVDPSHEDKYDRFESVLSPDLITRQNQFLADPTRNSEGIDLLTSRTQMQAARLLPQPLIVLTRGLPDAPSPVWPSAALQGIERELQGELARLSPQGRQIMAAASGHFIHHDQPDLVIAAVREILGLPAVA
ncbi:MAG: alpha/beta hydrolase [Chloroflexota bacterium]|nr:alpha/beta hydrolase [Chloroflexota bacterium]